MKLLITGICGFVGSTLARELVEATGADQCQIIGMDNLSRSGSWQNLAPLRSLGIEVIHGDARSASDLEAIAPVDWVIDAAANASVTAGVDGRVSSRQLIDHNLGGTINVLEQCKRWNAGLIFLSTSRVYSIDELARVPLSVADHAFAVDNSGELPACMSAHGVDEGFSTSSPISLYGASKLASESLAAEYGHAFGFPVWINRCGVMAGGGQFGKQNQGIYAYWLHSWKANKPLKYLGFGGHGHQVRDCLHPKDLAALVRKQLDSTGTDRPQTVNVSGGLASATSLANLSHWCADRWGARDVIADGSSRPYDLPWVVLDNRLASEHWSWRPEISIDAILTEIADFADAHPQWNDPSG